MKKTQFLVLGSMIALGNLMVGSISAALTVSNNYQINGPYANSGFITDGDSIHYTINYSGGNSDISGGIIDEYNGAISTGACFSNISLSSSGSITFFDENNQQLSGGLDCTTRSFSAILYQDGDQSILVDQGQSMGWGGSLNNNGQGNYQKYDTTTNEYKLYIWDGTQSILVDQGQDTYWNGSLNNNGQGGYQKYGSSTNEYKLYIWDGTQSILVDQGQNTYWNGGLNNNAQGNYQKYGSSTNENKLYIWDGTQSILVDQGQDTYWNGSLNNNGQGGYQKYDSSTNEYKLYIWDGTQSILVDQGQNTYWRSNSLNNNGQGGYQKYDTTTNENKLYIWDGTQSILVDQGQNIYWGDSLNNNGQGGYQKYDTTTNEYKLYIWDGSQSILVDQGQDTYWNGSLNNNGQGGYQKYDSSTNEYKLYIWDGTQSILVDQGQNMYWSTSLNNNGQGGYQKYDTTTNEYKLYIGDGDQSILVDQGQSMGWGGSLNNNGQGGYQKYDTTTNENKLYIWDGNQSLESTIEYDISIQSGVTQNNIQSITTSGTYNNELSGNNFVHQHIIYYPTNSLPKFAGGGASSSSNPKDTCPNGDHSPSYYDQTCEGPKEGATGTQDIDPDNITLIPNINNTTITDGYCYNKKNNIFIKDSKIFETSKEFKQSLEFMYAYGMTMYDSIDEFKPNDNLTREQAAKIFTNFATNILCRSSKQDDKSIEYVDIQDADANLVPYIKQAYTLGLMKGSKDNKFRPKDTITKAELNATIIRMILQSDLPEDTESTRYDEYNKVSEQLGIIKKKTDNSPVIRKFASLMFFRAYKNQIFSLQNINDRESFVLDNRDQFIK